MIKVTGLDQFQRTLQEAGEAFKALDGQIATLRFSPDDPASIDRAIHEMEAAIDSKAAPYSDNSFVQPIVEQLKEKYRTAILERAAEARLKGDQQ
jgi:hypothetical protein